MTPNDLVTWTLAIWVAVVSVMSLVVLGAFAGSLITQIWSKRRDFW